jgi:type I restriction enzyme M protein
MVELGEVFQIESGGTPSSKNSEYWEGNIKWVTLVDIPENISIISDTKRKITQEGLKKSSAKLLPKGTVLVSSRATIGRIAVIDCEMATNQGFKNIIIDDKNNSLFVAHMLSNQVEKMNLMASGGTFKEISKSAISTIKIPLPPLDVQEQIVAEIEGYQRVIDGAKQVVEKWKPTFRIDPEWEMVELGEVTDLIQRGKSPKYGESKIQVIKSGQARGYFDFDFKNKYFVEQGFPIDHRKLQHEDLLINSTGVGTAGRVTLFNLKGDFLVDSHITIVRLKHDRIKSEYTLFALDKIYGFKGLERMARGNGGQIELGLNVIKDLKIPLPPLDVQEQIVAEIEEEQKAVNACKTLIEKMQKKIEKKVGEVWGE